MKDQRLVVAAGIELSQRFSSRNQHFKSGDVVQMKRYMI